MRASLPLLLLLLPACNSDGPEGDTGNVPDDTGSPDTSDTGPVDTAPVDTGTGWWSNPEEDADGDGITEADGDCDDANAQVYPHAFDTCDGLDNDCDGTVDEEPPPDTWEPNDVVATPLGDLTDEPETLLYGYLHPATDEDRFRFYVYDKFFGYFDVEVWLYGVPPDADYALELYWVADDDGVPHGLVDEADEFGLGGYELINYGGFPGLDDTGWYEAVVRSTSGSGCVWPYTVQILVGGW
jgi:hypothetical protein